jgi:hypothetical protein
MTEKKSWGSSVIGWFVVQDPPPASESETSGEESSPAESDAIAGAAANQEPLDVFRTAPPAATGGNVDYDQVFGAAGISDDERERVKRTLDLLTSLPPDTDEQVKKQIVMASLRAFAVPIDSIIETAAEELQALEAYIRAGASDTEKLTTDAEARIKKHEQEIEELRKVMQQRVDEQQSVIRGCNAKKLDVQKVLEFFAQEAVARVVRASPKLQEPNSGKLQEPNPGENSEEK